MHGIGVGHELVEHLRAVAELFIVVAFLVEESDGFAVAALCVVVFLHGPVDVAETEQEHAFLDAVACRLGIAFLVGGNGIEGVAFGHVYVSDGVVYLVEVFLVLVGDGHALEAAYHLPTLRVGEDLGHGDAGVELHLVGWVEAHDALVGLVGFCLLSEGRLQLSHEEPLSCLLFLSVFVADDLAQIGNGFLVVCCMDVVVSHGVVPLMLCRRVDGVAAHVADDVFGVVEPVEFYVALGQPGACTAVDGGLRMVDATHIGEGGCGLVETAFVELRLPHHEPCLPKERVVFLTVEPFQVAFGLPPFLGPFGLALDAVELDDFLALLDGLVEVAAAELPALLVADSVEGNDLGEVVLVAVLLLYGAVDVGELAVIEGVVFGFERMPRTALRSILLRRTGCRQHHKSQQQHRSDMSCAAQSHI